MSWFENNVGIIIASILSLVTGFFTGRTRRELENFSKGIDIYKEMLDDLETRINKDCNQRMELIRNEHAIEVKALNHKIDSLQYEINLLRNQ